MKRACFTLRNIAATVFAVMTAVVTPSCTDSPVADYVPQVREYTFALEAVSGPDTRTSLITGDVIAWNSADHLGTYAPGTANLESSVIPGAPATFTISLAQGIQAGEKMYFYYPYSASAGNDPSTANLCIPASQSGDFSALPMAALPYTVQSAFVSGEVIPSLRFCPLGSMLELCIYSEVEAYRSERVQSVSFQAQDAIAGQFAFDLTSVDYSDLSTLSISGLTENSVTVTPAAATMVGGSRTDVTPLYMVLAPGRHSGTLTVTTDKASYVYDLSERDFARNAIKPMAVKLTAAVRKAPCFKRVTAASQVTNGRYVIAARMGDAYYAMPGSMAINSSKKVESVPVTVTDDIVTSEDAEGLAVEIKVTDKVATISNGTTYLSHLSASGTDLDLETSSFSWTVTQAAGDTVRLASSLDPRRCIIFRHSYKSFGAYSIASFQYGGYSEILLFKYDGEVIPVTPSTPEPSVNTGIADNISESCATVWAAFYNTTAIPREIRFEYGTSASSLDHEAYFNDKTPDNGVSFSVVLSNLTPSTTYYYRAVMQVGDSDVYGEVRSFMTKARATSSGESYTWLELPASSSGQGLFSESLFASGKRNYSYLYDCSLCAALWVAYPLSKEYIGSTSRSAWSVNPSIPEEYQISVKSRSYGTQFGNSVYSRGHQVPHADRNADKAMNEQVFYLTNQLPQVQNRFNDGVWNTLESTVRASVPSGDTIYVVTGPSYQKVGGNETVKYLTASNADVTPQTLAVPNYFWKAILKVKRSGGQVVNASAVGFWFEHHDYTNSPSLNNFAVSVDQIEAWTGFDLFTNLPDDIEAVAEANSSWSSFTAF
ncbi:MAG: DNA/RNA non-specific endonuclease [Bacteroidales bacterium]|nr:DNA/RNA non-specific endonuclease [Candidatus Cryptobacteroides onthequi]